MEYEWDETKSAINAVKHEVAFELVELFDWSTAIIIPDAKHSINEERFAALGFIGDRLYLCIHTWRDDRCRVISLRKANTGERKFYAQKNT